MKRGSFSLPLVFAGAALAASILVVQAKPSPLLPSSFSSPGFKPLKGASQAIAARRDENGSTHYIVTRKGSLIGYFTIGNETRLNGVKGTLLSGGPPMFVPDYGSGSTWVYYRARRRTPSGGMILRPWEKLWRMTDIKFIPGLASKLEKLDRVNAQKRAREVAEAKEREKRDAARQRAREEEEERNGSTGGLRTKVVPHRGHGSLLGKWQRYAVATDTFQFFDGGTVTLSDSDGLGNGGRNTFSGDWRIIDSTHLRLDISGQLGRVTVVYIYRVSANRLTMQQVGYEAEEFYRVRQ